MKFHTQAHTSTHTHTHKVTQKVTNVATHVAKTKNSKHTIKYICVSFCDTITKQVENKYYKFECCILLKVLLSSEGLSSQLDKIQLNLIDCKVYQSF